MNENQLAAEPVEEQSNPVDSKTSFFRKYRKALLITTAVTVLNLIYGFDPRFTIINLLWLLV